MPTFITTPAPMESKTVPAAEPVRKPHRPRKRWFLLLSVLALLSGDALLTTGEAEGKEASVEVPAAIVFQKLTPTAEELAALLSLDGESAEAFPDTAAVPESAGVVDLLPGTTEALDLMPGTMEAVGYVPGTTEAVGHVPGTTEAVGQPGTMKPVAEAAQELNTASAVEPATEPAAAAEPTAATEPAAAAEPAAEPAAAREADWMVFQGRSIRITPEAEWCGYEPGDFVWDGDRVRYTGTAYDAVFGIDVSRYHNEEHADGRLDWTAARADGVEFAIIRAGGRGSSEGKLYEDKYFTVNVEDAHAAGILTGAYIYSQAVSVEEALEEAEFLLSRMEGLPIDGPVCYDWEVPGRSSRAWSVPPETATAAAAAFCARIAEAGYTPLIYESKEVGYLKYDQEVLAPYMRWYPQYPSRKTAHPFPDFRYHMALWQFSDRCTVAGIGKRTDGSLWLRPRASE